MAVALVYHVVIFQWKLNKFPDGGDHEKEDGVVFSIEHLWQKGEIPIKGCVDFNIRNMGTAKAYLFNGAVEILPGQTWVPEKSTHLRYINQPVLTFEGDYQMTRKISDLNSAANNQSSN